MALNKETKPNLKNVILMKLVKHQNDFISHTKYKSSQ